MTTTPPRINPRLGAAALRAPAASREDSRPQAILKLQPCNSFDYRVCYEPQLRVTFYYKAILGLYEVVNRWLSLAWPMVGQFLAFLVNSLLAWPIHSDLFSEFWSDDSFWGYTAQIWLSSIPIVFLGVKDYRKNEKGRQRSWRPNKGQRVNNT